MVNEDLEVVEITFTIITPWSRQDFFDIWMASLLLRHPVFTVQLSLRIRLAIFVFCLSLGGKYRDVVVVKLLSAKDVACWNVKGRDAAKGRGLT